MADFNNAKASIITLNAYLFSDSDSTYEIADIEISGITRNLDNDSYEYYYYLSHNESEKNITDWVKVKENQTDTNKLKFSIKTIELPNYEELLESDEDNLYLYIKEVVKKGENQSTFISDSIILEEDDNTEINFYVDNEKNFN